jgi:hypothetical protein
VAQIRSLRAPVTLQQRRPHRARRAHFLVPCDTDKPPKPRALRERRAGGPNWRLLDANPIVDRLRARKQATDAGNVSATMSKMMSADDLALTGRLATLWGDPPRRGQRRDPAGHERGDLRGPQGDRHFVSLDAQMDAEAQQDALRRGITMPVARLAADDRRSRSRSSNGTS